MKNIILLSLSLFTFISCSKKDPPISTADEQIAKDLIQGAFDNIWGGIDTAQVATYHTDDFIILEQGEIWDNKRIKAFMLSQKANNNRPERINNMEYISIEKYGASMQIAYHNRAKFMQADTLAGTARWLESALAVQTPDGWRLKMMHSTWVGNE